MIACTYREMDGEKENYLCSSEKKEKGIIKRKRSE